MYIYIYIEREREREIYMCVYMYIYIYIYIHEAGTGRKFGARSPAWPPPWLRLGWLEIY